MIECKADPIPDVRAKELGVWMGKQEYQLLRKVIEAKGKKLIAEFSKALIESRNAPQKVDLASVKVQEIHRYQYALDVLDEIYTDKIPPQLAKLS